MDTSIYCTTLHIRMKSVPSSRKSKTETLAAYKKTISSLHNSFFIMTLHYMMSLSFSFSTALQINDSNHSRGAFRTESNITSEAFTKLVNG